MPPVKVCLYLAALQQEAFFMWKTKSGILLESLGKLGIDISPQTFTCLFKQGDIKNKEVPQSRTEKDAHVHVSEEPCCLEAANENNCLSE